MNNKRLPRFSYLLLAGTLIMAAAHRTQAQGTLTKEITQEVATQKDALIRVVSSSRKITIKSWDQPNVKITMEVIYDTSYPRKNKTDIEWFEDLGIHIKPFSNRLDILTGASTHLSAGKVYLTPSKEVVVHGQKSNTAGKTVPLKLKAVPNNQQTTKPKEVVVSGYRRPTIRIMSIIVPAGCKLDIENNYGDVVIGMNVDEARLKIDNGTLDALDIKDLKLVANYSTANLGNIEKAEVEFKNGSFRARNITDLDMDSRSSSIEYEKGNYIYVRSDADHYTINAIDKLDGRKTYGSIKIEQLNNSFDLEGNNVDIKIRNISQEVSDIKIKNKYGDLRLPVKNLKNYYVDFIGEYSTVFAPFQKEVVKEEEKKPVAGETNDKLKEVTVVGYAQKSPKPAAAGIGEVAPRHFTSSVGDTKNKHTRIELTCHYCTLDFK